MQIRISPDNAEVCGVQGFLYLFSFFSEGASKDRFHFYAKPTSKAEVLETALGLTRESSPWGEAWPVVPAQTLQTEKSSQGEGLGCGPSEASICDYQRFRQKSTRNRGGGHP